MSKTFFAQLNNLKAVLSGSLPAEDKFAAIRPMLSDADVSREFWKLLDDEAWIGILKSAGVFNNPPATEEVPGGGVRFPFWPASKYLVRVAKRAPAEVAGVFASVETENVSIIGDMIEAALAMPIDKAEKLVGRIGRAAGEGTLWIHFKDASDLCAKCATEGRLDLALALASDLFTPKAREGKPRLNDRDDYWYKDGLIRILPILAIKAPTSILPMACDWLDLLVRSTKDLDSESRDDHSYIWRPAVEEHEQNHDYDLAGVVVGCVREAFERAIREGRVSLEYALQLLDMHHLLVFERVTIYLLAEFGEQQPTRLRAAILDRESFDDHQVKHEYAKLVGRKLARLSEPDQKLWFQWIDEGPDMSGFDENIRQYLHREATAEDRKTRVDYWKFEKLHWIRDSISEDRREFYQRMLAKNGTPEMADFNFRTSSVWGEQTPTTVEHLATMTFDAAVDWVTSWKPPAEGVNRPSLGGFVGTFSDYVSKNPEDFSRKALTLRGRHPSFVSAFIRQMSAATKAGREIDLQAVLALSEWAVTSAAGKDWRQTRDEVSELIRTVCQSTREDRPRFEVAEFRAPIWNLVRHLYRDDAKSNIVRDTSDDDLRLHDYFELGINSSRGKAVEAGLDFARWVALDLTAGGKHETVPGGFEAIPEVRELLEWQLEPANQSLEVMAVIGASIGVIHWIDASWLGQNASRLFNLRGIERGRSHALGWAAWNAFLVWVRPHFAFYNLFEAEFVYSVRQAALVKLEKRDHDQPMYRLGEHLMVLYGRGQLALSDPVLQELLAKANPAIRRHAIGFVGSSLGRDTGLPGEVTQRFMKLWDTYWEGEGKTDAAQEPNAVSFGSWFACEVFPSDWAIDCLLKFVRVVPVPEPEHMVMEQLEKVAHLDLPKSVEILDRMINGDRDGWRIQGWQESLKNILAKAVSPGSAAREEANDVIEHLGRLGYTDFGELLAQ